MIALSELTFVVESPVEAYPELVTVFSDSATTLFKIVNGDWSLSPSGDMVAFLSAQDGNIWLLEIP